MSFRQFGGLKYNAKHNAVSSNFNTSNNLVIREDAGISDNLKITNDLLVKGDTDVCGNSTAYYMYLSSGDKYATEPNALVPKSYVDLYVTGLNPQDPVTCISTYDNQSNTTTYPVPIYPNPVSSSFQIDGYSVKVDDSVLLNDQGIADKTASVDNGVYVFTNIGTSYYFIRSATELPIGYNAQGAYIKTVGGTTDFGKGWVQTKRPGIVGTDPILFYPFNPSSSNDVEPGIGLYSSQLGTAIYFNVDSSLNFLTGIDASGGGTLDVGTQSSTLNLGSIDTSVNIAGNPYVYTPFSIGSTFSPQTLNITSTSSSTNITFNWTIPSLYQNIPTSIQSINATLYADINGSINTYPIITSSTSGINIATLNTIVVTNQSSTIGQSGNTYTYNSSQITNTSLLDNSNNQLILWYTNYSPYPNVSYVGYTPFSSFGTPGPVYFNFGGAPTTSTAASVDSSFVVTDCSVNLPCYVQVVDQNNSSVEQPPYIINYRSQLGQYTTLGSSNRYEGPYTVNGATQTFSAGNPGTGSNTNTTCIFSNMYPDCSYSFIVQAQNSGNSGYGPDSSANIYSKTLPPSYPPTIQPSSTSLFSPSGSYTYTNPGYFVSNNGSASPILNVNSFSTSLTSNNIITPVQQSGTYGNNSLGSSLNVTAKIVHTSTTTQTTKTVTSFPGGQTFTDSSGGITVLAKTFDAYYNGGAYNQGFYLDCSTNMTITSSYFSGFTHNDASYNATLSVTGNGVVNPTPTSSYPFYADDLSLNPTYNSIGAFTLNSNNNYYSNQVSGIWVLNTSQNPVFSVSNLKLNNMGDYFYASPLVTYNIGGGVSGSQSENDTTHVTNISSSGSFQNPIDISNNSVSGNVSSSYSTDISLNITFKNLVGQGSSNNIAIINVICDNPSYQLSNNIKTFNPLGISSPGVNGYRVWSANVDSGIPSSLGVTTMTPSGIAPYVYIVNGTSIPNNTATGSNSSGSTQGYVSIPYNNIWDISGNSNTNQEMLIASGGFTTNSSFYLNYATVSSANGNTVNYTGLASTGNNGLKFATFAWNISSNFVGNQFIHFVITTNNALYYNPATQYYYFDSNNSIPLYLFYRFEYNDFSGPGNQIDGTYWGIQSGSLYYPNTTWISCNYTTGDSTLNNATATVVCNFSNVYKIYWYQCTSITLSSTNTYDFKATIPANLNIDSNSALYLRVGIPSGQTTRITNVQSYTSSN